MREVLVSELGLQLRLLPSPAASCVNAYRSGSEHRPTVIDGAGPNVCGRIAPRCIKFEFPKRVRVFSDSNELVAFPATRSDLQSRNFRSCQ
jgi:hypothetical protein